MTDPEVPTPEADPETEEQVGDSAGKRAWSAGREIVIVVVVALIVSAVVRAFLFQAFFVPSASMENTLLINDRILVSKIDRHFGSVHRGEVIVFSDPGGWLPPPVNNSSAAGVVQKGLQFIGVLPSTSEDHLVKRIIGIPGDHVKCCSLNREIIVNGKALDEKAYIMPNEGTDQIQFDIVVPAGNVFVMGDNRANSADSRYHLSVRNGGVPISDITGRAVLRIWPASRWGTLPIPDVLKTVPPATK